MSRILRKISELKKKRKAIVIAHYFQNDEVQDASDFVGGKLECALFAGKSKAEVIVVAGVGFMAELVKLLAPDKVVLHPREDALCPMVAMVEAEQIEEIRDNTLVIGYIKSKPKQMALCHAVADLDRLEKLLEDKCVFLPDRYVGDYFSKKLGKKFMLAEGYCPPHTRILAGEVKKLKEEHAKADILAHPQCRGDVLELADFISNTTGMVDFVSHSAGSEFIVCTEIGLKHSLEKEFPEKSFYFPSEFALCRNHKSIDLGDIYLSMKEMEKKVEIPEDIAEKARQALHAGGII